jgi:hypothetical protein
MKTFISICTTLLFLLMACHATFADVVEDPVLYLDAADNPAHPKAWENLGTEGGELLVADKPMELEEGEIKIPVLGVSEPNALSALMTKHYPKRRLTKTSLTHLLLIRQTNFQRFGQR